MVSDEYSHILEYAQDGATAFLDAGISLHRAIRSIEIGEVADSLDDLKEAHDYLDDAADQMGTVVELAHQATAEGSIRTADEEFPGEGSDTDESGERLFEHLKRKHEFERLFYHDPELWEYLSSSALVNQPFAGYALQHTHLTLLRNSVSGIVDDIDGLLNDVDDAREGARIQNAMWRATRLYMRTMIIGNLISYINRETREAT